MQNVHLTPPEIARLMGVNVSTIKRWVDKGILPAEKTSGGHRRVSRDDVRSFVESYNKVANRSYILKKLGAQKEDFDHEDYYDLLLSRQYEEAAKLLHRAYIAGLSVIDILEKIIVPTLVFVGNGWRQGVLSIESEHRMSFVVRDHIIKLENFISTGTSAKAKSVLLTCTPGENHELSLHILSVALRSLGYKTEVLGINISAQELEHAVASYSPDYLALSKVYTMNALPRNYISNLARIAKDHKTKLVVGGSGWTKQEMTKLNKALPNTIHLTSLSALTTLHTNKKT